jgi:tetratricopeptide (TPR) repeat protein
LSLAALLGYDPELVKAACSGDLSAVARLAVPQFLEPAQDFVTPMLDGRAALGRDKATEAIEKFNQALARLEQTVGPVSALFSVMEFPWLDVIRINIKRDLARALADAERTTEAIAVLRDALTAHERADCSSAGHDAKLCVGLRNQLAVLLAPSDLDGASAAVERGLALGAKLPDRAFELREARSLLREIRELQRKWTDADALLQKQIEGAEQWLGAQTSWLEQIEWLGTEYCGTDPALGEAFLTCAHRLNLAARGAHHGATIAVQAALGAAQKRAGRTAEGSRTLEGALAAAEQLAEESDRDEIWQSLAEGLADDDIDVATRAHERLLALKRAKGLDIAGDLLWFGIALIEAGRVEEAEARLTRALRIREAADGPESRLVAEVLFALACVVLEAGRADEAEQVCRRAIAIVGADGPREDETAYANSILARIYVRTNRAAEALDLAQKSADWRRAHASRDALASSLYVLGEAQRSVGAASEALASHREALVLRERVLSPHHLYVGRSLARVAEFERLCGVPEKASDRQQRAHRILAGVLGQDHPEALAVKPSA